MKNKLTVLCILSAVCIFNSCSKDKPRVYDLSRGFTDTLTTPDDHLISTIILEIDGEINGKGILEVQNNTHPDRFKEILLETSKIDIDHRSDWYDSTYIIRYTPSDSTTTGTMSLKYNL